MIDRAALRKAHVEAFMKGDHDEYIRTWLLLDATLNRKRQHAKPGEGKDWFSRRKNYQKRKRLGKEGPSMLPPDKFRTMKNPKLQEQFDRLAYAHFEANRIKANTSVTEVRITDLLESIQEQLVSLKHKLDSFELPRPAKAAPSPASAFPANWPWRDASEAETSP